MPTRKFCDLCDTQISDDQCHHSIDIDTHNMRDKYRIPEFFDEGDRTRRPVPVHVTMVCFTCIVNLRQAMEKVKRDAIQEREAT